MFEEKATNGSVSVEMLEAYERVIDDADDALGELLAIEKAEVREAQGTAVGAIRTARVMLGTIAVVSIIGGLTLTTMPWEDCDSEIAGRSSAAIPLPAITQMLNSRVKMKCVKRFTL